MVEYTQIFVNDYVVGPLGGIVLQEWYAGYLADENACRNINPSLRMSDMGLSVRSVCHTSVSLIPIFRIDRPSVFGYGHYLNRA